MFCKQQVAQLRGIVDRIHEHGAELVAVGNGNAKQAAAFVKSEQVSFPLVTDPSLRTYRAAGLKSGLLTGVSLGVLGRGLRAFSGGFRQSRTQGHPLQQGGAFVFDAGGRELYRYLSKEAGDHPDPDDFLAALP